MPSSTWFPGRHSTALRGWRPCSPCFTSWGRSRCRDRARRDARQLVRRDRDLDPASAGITNEACTQLPVIPAQAGIQARKSGWIYFQAPYRRRKGRAANISAGLVECRGGGRLGFVRRRSHMPAARGTLSSLPQGACPKGSQVSLRLGIGCGFRTAFSPDRVALDVSPLIPRKGLGPAPRPCRPVSGIAPERLSHPRS